MVMADSLDWLGPWGWWPLDLSGLGLNNSYRMPLVLKFNIHSRPPLVPRAAATFFSTQPLIPCFAKIPKMYGSSWSQEELWALFTLGNQHTWPFQHGCLYSWLLIFGTVVPPNWLWASSVLSHHVLARTALDNAAEECHKVLDVRINPEIPNSCGSLQLGPTFRTCSSISRSKWRDLAGSRNRLSRREPRWMGLDQVSHKIHRTASPFISQYLPSFVVAADWCISQS